MKYSVVQNKHEINVLQLKSDIWQSMSTTLHNLSKPIQ